MEELVQKYSRNDKINLDASIFLNLAAGFFYNYYSTQDNNDKGKCVTYLNESLRKLSDYGEAHGLKLELFMLDYARTKDEAEKQKILDNVKQVFELIKSSEVACKEVIQRFERVKNVSAEGNTILLLKDLFPKDWEEVEKIAAGKK